MMFFVYISGGSCFRTGSLITDGVAVLLNGLDDGVNKGLLLDLPWWGEGVGLGGGGDKGGGGGYEGGLLMSNDGGSGPGLMVVSQWVTGIADRLTGIADRLTGVAELTGISQGEVSVVEDGGLRDGKNNSENNL
jgi:hypothetical protein